MSVAAEAVTVRRLGRADYVATWQAMREFTRRRDEAMPDELWLLEHPPVYTLGQGADPAFGPGTSVIPIIQSDRGGEITYHGPGQLVGYPIIDLARHGSDVHGYLRELEAVLIEVADGFGVKAERRSGFTGVWVGDAKLAAIGVGIRRWVTMHGFALNVHDLRDPFSAIVPCGLAGSGVTSLTQETGRVLDLDTVAGAIVTVFGAHFGYDAVVERRP